MNTSVPRSFWKVRWVSGYLPLLVAVPVFAATPAEIVSGLGRTGQTGSADSQFPQFSADGRCLVFISRAKNLVAQDDQGAAFDVFLHDLSAGHNVLVSINLAGVGGGDDHSLLPSVSSNGQFVAFASAAANLVPGDTNRTSDIFVRDIHAGVTRLITRGAHGQAANGASTAPIISRDGRFVVFESLASNLVTNDHNATNDVFVHDLMSGVTTLVSVNAEGSGSANGPSWQPAASADGRTIAFTSLATDLVAGVSNRWGEVYVRDLALAATSWASALRPAFFPGGATFGSALAAHSPVLTPDGRFVAYKVLDLGVARFDTTGQEAWQAWPSIAQKVGAEPLLISASGRYLAFTTSTEPTDSSRLVPVPNGLFRVEAGAPDPVRISVTPEGTAAVGFFAGVSMSADGEQFIFASTATDLVAGTEGTRARLYLRDQAAGRTLRLSDTLGHRAETTTTCLSPDATLVAFDADGPWLATNDFNRASDVFVQDLAAGAVTLVSRAHPDRPAVTGPAMAYLPQRPLSARGDKVLFIGHDNSHVAGDTNRWLDLFLRDRTAGTVDGLGGPIYPDPDAAGNLTNSASSAVQAVIDASGRYVLMERRRGEPGGAVTNLPAVETRTGTFRDFGGVPGGNPSMSADGRVWAGEVTRLPGVFDGSGSTRRVVDRNRGPDVVVERHADSSDPGQNLVNPDYAPVIEVVSVVETPRGLETGIGPSWAPLVSPNGRWVAFLSLATDLTTNRVRLGTPQLFVRDLVEQRTRLLSRDPNGEGLAGGASNAVFSGHSGFVVFEVPGERSIWRYDLGADSLTEVCANCWSPSIDGEGRWVVYLRQRADGVADVMLRDLESGAEELVSVGEASPGGGNGSSTSPSISFDGRFVVFASRADNLASGDTNGRQDIFVRDRWLGRTFLASAGRAGGGGNGSSRNPILSPDGRVLAFESFASDLVAGDFNDRRDVFLVPLTGADADGDGMEDVWEQHHFGTLARDGAGDFDGDGHRDGQEFGGGTDPTAPASALRLIRLAVDTDGAQPDAARRVATAEWQAAPGRAYRVEFKDSLEDVHWIPLPGDVVAGASTASRTHVTTNQPPAWVDSPQRFYRVRLVE